MTIDPTEVMKRAKAVPDFAGYFITVDGILISTRRGRPILKRPYIQGKYVRVGISNRTGSQQVQEYIHTLILMTYVGPRPTPQQQARHLNGDSLDNRLDNLAWGSPVDNAADRRRHGRYTDTLPAGDQHHNAKLNEADVVTILRRLANGETQRAIAIDYQIAQTTISKIARNKRWKCVGTRSTLHINSTPALKAA